MIKNSILDINDINDINDIIDIILLPECISEDADGAGAEPRQGALGVVAPRP